MSNESDLEKKMERLISQLTQGTESGTVKWSETPDPDTFRAKLHSGMVRVQRSTSLDESGEECASFYLTLLDSKGRELEDFFPRRGIVSERMLIELWTLARRQARDTINVLDSLLGETKVAAG